MTQPPQASRMRFAAVIRRILADARDRGMTDGQIKKATGVSPSTFHRWQKGDFITAPDVDKVVRFCDGLGVPPSVALRTLSAEATAKETLSPEPPIPPDVRRILRGLVDPNVSDSDKTLVREMLKILAIRVTKDRDTPLDEV